MGKLRSTNIEPQSGTNLTLGASGDAVTIASTETKANTVKDAGGNTLWTSDGSGTLSSMNSALQGGGLTLITTQTITSNVTTVNFASGIDSTYDEYIFILNDIDIDTGGAEVEVNFFMDALGATTAPDKTTTAFRAYHSETSTDTILGYATAEDLAISGGFQRMNNYMGNSQNNCGAGVLHLFQPSSSTAYKQFYSRFNGKREDGYTQDSHMAGVIITTTPIIYVRFAMNTGNMTGIFQMYGVS